MEQHKKNDFEVISDSDSDSDSESKSITSSNDYSQNDKTFALELYKENRHLLNEIKEKDNIITDLKYRNIYLKNSNIFWFYCYIGTFVVKLVSMQYI